MKPRVAFTVHMLAPYRVTFYEKLFADKEHQWKLFAGLKFRKNDPKPQFEGKVNYEVSYHKEHVQNNGMFQQLVYEGMLEAVQEYNPDVVIVFAHVGTKSFRQVVDWAKANGKKVIMWTCFWTPKHAVYKQMIRSYFVKSFYAKADYHLAYSSLAREKLIDIGVPQQNIAIAYNGIDVAQYRADLMMDGAEAGFDRSVVNFVYVGAFDPSKGVELLITALGKCKNQYGLHFNALLIGDGPTRPFCQQLVSQYNLEKEVKLPGRIPNSIGKYFKAADCIVMPGAGGLLLNEAVLFKKPMVVAEADGTEVDLVINGFNGLRFASDDADSLAQSLIELSDNLQYYHDNAALMVPLVTERSNTDVMAETFTNMVRRALGENPPANKRPVQMFAQNNMRQQEQSVENTGF